MDHKLPGESLPPVSITLRHLLQGPIQIGHAHGILASLWRHREVDGMTSQIVAKPTRVGYLGYDQHGLSHVVPKLLR